MNHSINVGLAIPKLLENLRMWTVMAQARSDSQERSMQCRAWSLVMSARGSNIARLHLQSTCFLMCHLTYHIRHSRRRELCAKTASECGIKTHALLFCGSACSHPDRLGNIFLWRPIRWWALYYLQTYWIMKKRFVLLCMRACAHVCVCECVSELRNVSLSLFKSGPSWKTVGIVWKGFSSTCTKWDDQAQLLQKSQQALPNKLWD